MNLGAVQAVEVVELHGRKRGAQFLDLRAGFLKLAALVIGADDEHAHILPARGLHGGPVEVVHEIPVQVHVIKFAGIDHLFDHIGGAVGGEAEETAAALFLQLAGNFETAAFL